MINCYADKLSKVWKKFWTLLFKRKKEMIKKYTLGFIFSNDLERLILVKKSHPEFQKDRLNGIGGKIENGESQFETIRRESIEECGYHSETWKYFGIIKIKKKADVYLFYDVCDKPLHEVVETKTDEEIGIYSTIEILSSDYLLMDEIPFLIEAALLAINNSRMKDVILNYEN